MTVLELIMMSKISFINHQPSIEIKINQPTIGNETAAYIAYRVNGEVCTIYPITPSSTMAELADEWAS